MVSERDFNLQESEREYGRQELQGVYRRLDKANKAIKIIGDTLREFRNINDNQDQHSDDYLDDLDSRIQTILQELEDMPNGY